MSQNVEVEQAFSLFSVGFHQPMRVGWRRSSPNGSNPVFPNMVPPVAVTLEVVLICSAIDDSNHPIGRAVKRS
jgi:hypothetical protein